MKKKLIVALVASTVLANGSSAAFAAKVSDSDNSSSTTTLASRPNKDNKIPRDKRIADEKATRAARILGATNARNAIMATFKTAMADAIKAKYSAFKSAKTVAQRKAASDAFNTAVAAANGAKTTALKSLTGGLAITTSTTTTTTVKP